MFAVRCDDRCADQFTVGLRVQADQALRFAVGHGAPVVVHRNFTNPRIFRECIE